MTTPDGDVRTVVVVDQFEELCNLCPDPAERQAFVDRLTRLAAAPDGPPSAPVVVGVRAGFYAASLPSRRTAGRPSSARVPPRPRRDAALPHLTRAHLVHQHAHCAG
ncbi:hypothetical protein ACIRL0_04980 [Streptomyces sp. NPDC102365]|uniref:nSTAND1 domain-containing NTPase n=1 Tax=Streptomyces sp. NPDC102365 TaxID=3366162 RepID=UPI003802FFBC